jgi:DNA-binding transcriptional ArsR family regulator
MVRRHLIVDSCPVPGSRGQNELRRTRLLRALLARQMAAIGRLRFSFKYTLTRICLVEYIKGMESVFEIIAEPNRRAILTLLVSSEQSVGEIERQLRMTQPTVSKHLRVLREAGFVESTVDAQRRLYRLKPEPFQQVDAWLAQFRRFWSAHVDALERHLDRLDRDLMDRDRTDKDESTPAKRKTTQQKTTRPKPRT